MMRRMRSANWGLALTAAFAISACEKKNEAPPTTTAPAAVTATAPAAPAAAPAESPDEANEAGRDLRRHHRHHHHGGVSMFIHMALDSIGVAPEKKAQIEKIQADLRATMAPSREAARNTLSIIADGVAAGTIDNAQVSAALAKQEAASAAVHAASADALNQLHAALSPAERAALVDKVKAHAEVWKKVSLDEQHGSKDKEAHLGRLTEELGLTPDQVEKISAALAKDAPPKPESAAIDAHVKAFETAFLADKFDAKTMSTANAANAQISKHGTARMVRFYTVVTPLLTSEQRTKLAGHLRERLNDPHAAK